MIITCLACEKRYKVDPERIPPRGGFVRCPSCTERIPVRRETATATRDAQQPEKQSAEAPETAEAPEAPEAPSTIHVLAEEGLLTARNAEEVRTWIFEGRIWPDNLVYLEGEEPKRADEHPLTQVLFGEPEAAAREEEETAAPPAGDALDEPEAPSAADTLDEPEAPSAADTLAEPETQPAGGTGARSIAAVVSAAVAAVTTAREKAKAAQETWTPEGAEGDVAPAPRPRRRFKFRALGGPESVPEGVRLLGVVNLSLSLVLPPNPLGIAAAIGLMRGYAWGRTLTTFWAGTQLFILLLVGTGFAAALAAAGIAAGPDAVPLSLWQGPVLLGALAFGALGAYFVVQWSYLSGPRISENLEEGSEQRALWWGWTLSWLYIAGIALVGVLLLPRLSADWFIPPHPVATIPTAPVTQAPTSNRVYTTDGLVSIDAPKAWSIVAVEGGDDAKLGVLLQGSRENPAGKVRVSSTRPRDVERMNKRFDSLQSDEETIQSVEAARIGDLEGRRIVLWSKVPGGMTGQILLSLEDGTRGYQFSCAAPGPGFEAIRPECDRMAQSLIITSEPHATGAQAADGDPAPRDALHRTLRHIFLFYDKKHRPPPSETGGACFWRLNEGQDPLVSPRTDPGP